MVVKTAGISVLVPVWRNLQPQIITLSLERRCSQSGVGNHYGFHST